MSFEPKKLPECGYELVDNFSHALSTAFDYHLSRIDWNYIDDHHQLQGLEIPASRFLFINKRIHPNHISAQVRKHASKN